MRTFYFFLWLRWAIRITLSSVGMALSGALVITLFIYLKQGSPELNDDVYLALLDIVKFWFPLTWSISLLIVLFRSLKYIFNIQISGYMLQLLDCSTKEVIDTIGYGDLIKVWRKWFMLIIWLIGSQMLIAITITYTFGSATSVFEWFSIYYLFVFLLIAGYFSFVLLGGRCKKVKVVKC